VIVISHGAGGNWNTHYAQAQHLASHGYVVLCVEHTGSNTQKMMKDAQIWANLMTMIRDSDEVLGRPRDISFAIDRAEDLNTSSGKLRGRLDMEHVGVMGHSFGAFTTMVICGMRPALNWLTPRVEPGTGIGPDLSDRRVDCGVALSPQGPDEPFFISESFGYLKIPLLGISGTNDQQQGGLPPETRLKAFSLWPVGENIFIWITNARHLDFTDSTGSGQFAVPSPTRDDVQTIVRVATLLFFDAHLKSDVSTQKFVTQSGLKRFLRGSIGNIEVLSK
jgi:predicted dienelactone hydrolase